MLNMTIQTYAKSQMSDGVATKDTPVYKSLTRAYNDISLIPNQITDENLLAPNQIIIFIILQFTVKFMVPLSAIYLFQKYKRVHFKCILVHLNAFWAI